MPTVMLVWSTTIALCLVLAGIHGQLWLRTREGSSSGIFAVLALCVAAIALTELVMMHATSVRIYLWLLRIFYVLALIGFIGLVYFAWAYLNAGRRWLGMTAIALRAGATLIGLFSPSGLHFQTLDALVPARFLGSPVMVPLGTPNPWLLLSLLAALVLFAFFCDAVLTLRRQGADRKRLLLGAMLALFLMVAQILGLEVAFSSLKTPLHVTLSFIPLICLIGAWLSEDLVQTARLSGELADAERRLLESRRRLSMAAEAAKVGFWVVDQATLRFRAVPMTMRLFSTPEGYTPSLEELLATMHPADRGSVRRAMSEAPVLDKLVSVEYRVFLPDGRTRWYLSVGGGQDVPGGTSQLMGMTMDITDRKQAEETANLQREATEHLSRAVMAGEMSGSLVQQLRQPLARILDKAHTSLWLLQSASRKPYEIRALLDEIVIASDGASQVIAKLRQLLRRGGQAPEALSLASLVDDVLVFLQPDLTRRGVQIHTELDRSLRPLLLERVRIEQVLIHLVINACDAMAFKPLSERELSICVRAADGAALITLTDRGTGLPPEGVNLFAAFYTTKPDSAGMGLAVCKSIVESYGGRIWAEPAESGGARFCVRLPFMEQKT